jgi:hypothetical protein
MAQTLPFHSVRPGTPNVFHNSDACQAGQRIQGATDWRAGDGGRPLCAACKRLNAGAGRRERSAPHDSTATDGARWRGVRGRRGPNRRVMAKCPTTGQTIWTGLSMTEDLLVNLDGSRFKLWCPACRAHHPWGAVKAHMGEESDGGGDERTLAR